jgi:isoquinoline 1-oxidoreductase beta subunit
MPVHASPDAGQSDAPAGPLTRRRFLTYVVAAPVLTVAASSVITPGKAYAVVPSPPQPENILDCHAQRSGRASRRRSRWWLPTRSTRA